MKCIDFCFVTVHESVFILSRVSQWLKHGYGLVIGFINNLQVLTTINYSYYTIAALHNVQPLHTNLFSLSALVLTGL
jgi:hypothetical protein